MFYSDNHVEVSLDAFLASKEYDKESIKDVEMVFDQNVDRSTTPCFDEHLSVRVLKTRIYLICGFRNPFEAESEKWQNSYQLSIGGVRKWVKRLYGLEISKSSVCFVRDKCGADKLEVGAAKIVPKLKSKKELAVLEAFKALGFITEKEEQSG